MTTSIPTSRVIDADKLPKVGETVFYRAQQMRGISFDADGRTVTETEVRSGVVQAVHPDHLVVGDDEGVEWTDVPLDDVLVEQQTDLAVETREDRDRRVLAKVADVPLPLGAAHAAEWSVDGVGDLATRDVYWFLANFDRGSVAVVALQDQDGALHEFGVDLYAPEHLPDTAAQARAFGEAAVKASDVAEVAAIAVLVHAQMQRAGIGAEQLAERAGIDLDTTQKCFGGEGDLDVADLRRIRKALGCSWADMLPDSVRATAPGSYVAEIVQEHSIIEGGQ